MDGAGLRAAARPRPRVTPQPPPPTHPPNDLLPVPHSMSAPLSCCGRHYATAHCRRHRWATEVPSPSPRSCCRRLHRAVPCTQPPPTPHMAAARMLTRATPHASSERVASEHSRASFPPAARSRRGAARLDHASSLRRLDHRSAHRLDHRSAHRLDHRSAHLVDRLAHNLEEVGVAAGRAPSAQHRVAHGVGLPEDSLEFQ